MILRGYLVFGCRALLIVARQNNGTVLGDGRNKIQKQREPQRDRQCIVPAASIFRFFLFLPIVWRKRNGRAGHERGVWQDCTGDNHRQILTKKDTTAILKLPSCQRPGDNFHTTSSLRREAAKLSFPTKA